MADIYADTVDELKNRLEYGISSGKLVGLVSEILVGAQPETRFGNDKLPVIIILDAGFEEKAFSASNQELDSTYTIVLRVLYSIDQKVKESGNTLYVKSGQSLPVALPADLNGTGLIYLRSKILDTVYTSTTGLKKCVINSGVRYIQASGDAPVLDSNKYYQDIRLIISTGLFSINGRNV